MPSGPASKTALVFTTTQIDPQILSIHSGANVIRTAAYEHGWLHLLECEQPKSYDDLEKALTNIEAELKTKSFLPVLDDSGCTSGKIILNPPLDTFIPTTTWTRPSESQVDKLLIPGLKRLSKQLKVDFAVNVHGSEGKRKTIQTIRERNARPQKMAATKSRTPRSEDPNPTSSFTEKAFDAVKLLHTEAIQSKDETIRALTNALATKEEIIRTQASLIMVLQHGSSRSL